MSKCLEIFGDEAMDMTTGKITAASILDLANAKREEKAPAEGSKTDKVLKWAVSFAKNVDAYSKVLDVYISKAPEVAGLVWGGCRILLQVLLPLSFEYLSAWSVTVAKIYWSRRDSTISTSSRSYFPS